MQIRKSKQLYHVKLEFSHGVTRTVKVRAVTREVAEKKALKFHPHAVVKHDA